MWDAEVKPAQATKGNVSSDEGEEEEYEEPASDYTALLQTLQATNETFAKAYAPRYSTASTFFWHDRSGCEVLVHILYTCQYFFSRMLPTLEQILVVLKLVSW